MRKKFLVLILICSVVFLCSCSLTVKKTDDAKSGSDILESAQEGTNTPEDINTPEDVDQNTAAEVTDSGLTLEKLKEAAEKLGYEVSFIEEYQLMGAVPKPVDGFNVHYVDENIDEYIPVFEFSSPEDALKSRY